MLGCRAFSVWMTLVIGLALSGCYEPRPSITLYPKGCEYQLCTLPMPWERAILTGEIHGINFGHEDFGHIDVGINGRYAEAITLSNGHRFAVDTGMRWGEFDPDIAVSIDLFTDCKRNKCEVQRTSGTVPYARTVVNNVETIIGLHPGLMAAQTTGGDVPIKYSFDAYSGAENTHVVQFSSTNPGNLVPRYPSPLYYSSHGRSYSIDADGFRRQDSDVRQLGERQDPVVVGRFGNWAYTDDNGTLFRVHDGVADDVELYPLPDEYRVFAAEDALWIVHSSVDDTQRQIRVIEDDWRSEAALAVAIDDSQSTVYEHVEGLAGDLVYYRVLASEFGVEIEYYREVENELVLEYYDNGDAFTLDGVKPVLLDVDMTSRKPIPIFGQRTDDSTYWLVDQKLYELPWQVEQQYFEFGHRKRQAIIRENRNDPNVDSTAYRLY